MTIMQLTQNRSGEMAMMARAWIDNVATDASEQLAPTRFELTNIYARSNIAYRAANKRGDAVSAIPLRILDSAGEPIPETDPLVKAFQRDIKANMRRSEITLCYFGYNMLMKRRSYNGSLYRLQWVNPTLYVRDILPDGLKGFRISNARREGITDTYIKRANAVFQTEFDFQDDFGGVAPARVALNPIEFGLEMGLTQHSFMKNRGAPAWVVSGDGTNITNQPTPEDANTLTNLVKRMFQGSANAGRTLVNRAAWKWTQLTTDWDKIKFSEQYADMYEAVAIAFDIPIALIRESASNYAQAEVARLDWANSWLVPRTNWYAELFTQQLLGDPAIVQRYGSGLKVEPDFTEVKMLQSKDSERTDTVNKQVQGGYRDLFTAAIEAGVKNPSESLRDMYMWNGVPTPITVINDLWKSKNPPPVVPPPPAASSTPVDTPPLVPPEAESAITPAAPIMGGKSVTFMLSLANNADLVSLQGMTRKYVGALNVEWLPPEAFHVTVCHMPNVTDEQIATLQTTFNELDVPEFVFKMGSLGTFDNLGSHAIHFKLRSNAVLNDFQEAVYKAICDLSIPTSGYSFPDEYKPHVTMGYAPDKVPAKAFYSGLKVRPTEFQLSVEHNVIATKPIVPDEPPPPKKTDFLPDEIFSELKVAARKGAGFVVDKLPSVTMTYIASLKDLQYETDTILTAAKSFTSSVLAAKALQDTRSSFEDELNALLSRARNEEATKQQFRSKLASLLNTYGRKAFMDGLTDGGMDPDEAVLDQEDKDAIATILSDQSQYVTDLTNLLYKGEGITDGEADIKAGLWWNKSVMPAYQAGLYSAASNGLFIWKRGPTSDSCEDCIALEGQKRRLKIWKKHNLMPPTGNTACGGWQCLCHLDPTTGKASGGSMPKLVSGKKSHEHEREQEDPIPA